MSNHTRRQFLGLVASLLTLIDAVRRFFKPPEVVKDHVDDWPAPNTGPYFDYYDGPYHTNDAIQKLRLLRGSNRDALTNPQAAEFARAMLKGMES